MFKHLILVIFLIAICFNVKASVIAIIDSGTDMKHKEIAPKAWVNFVEIPDNLRDDDGNGYPDDIFGWNFPEQNNVVIDYSYLGYLNDDVKKFFAIQTKTLSGEASQEEIDWYKAQAQNASFIKHLGIYGNFMHGTHVAAITARGNNEARVMAIKLIPTEVKMPWQSIFLNPAEKGVTVWVLKKLFAQLAKQQMVMMEEIGAFVEGHKADVANGSFGTGFKQAEMIIAGIFQKVLRRNPTNQESREIALHFLNTLIDEGRRMTNASPKTLFIFAAGNDGTNNDLYPTSPANIKSDNSISVAATFGRESIAKFSNYGKQTVDVAAPGVAILSAVPGDEYLRVSGTSQAAPYVANVAGKIKDLNKGLAPKEIKEIILNTVDVKEFLKDKVLTSGIVNDNRAIFAAMKSKTMPLLQAIALAKKEISDMDSSTLEKGLIKHRTQIDDLFVLPLPSLFTTL